MKYYFSNKKLERLYTTGKCTKYKLDKVTVYNFISTIDIIDAAKDIYDFWDEPALNFEKLTNCKKRYSFRIDKKYRLEVEIVWEDKNKTIGIVAIEEISKHYQ